VYHSPFPVICRRVFIRLSSEFKRIGIPMRGRFLWTDSGNLNDFQKTNHSEADN